MTFQFCSFFTSVCYFDSIMKNNIYQVAISTFSASNYGIIEIYNDFSCKHICWARRLFVKFLFEVLQWFVGYSSKLVTTYSYKRKSCGSKSHDFKGHLWSLWSEISWSENFLLILVETTLSWDQFLQTQVLPKQAIKS